MVLSDFGEGAETVVALLIWLLLLFICFGEFCGAEEGEIGLFVEMKSFFFPWNKALAAACFMALLTMVLVVAGLDITSFFGTVDRVLFFILLDDIIYHLVTQ